MRRLQLLVLAAVAACTSATRSVPAESPAMSPGSAVDAEPVRGLLRDANVARDASDYAAARERATEAVTLLLERPAAERDASWLELLDEAGLSAWQAQDAGTARSAWAEVLAHRELALPDDDLELQRVRGHLALALQSLGDVEGAHALLEKVQAVLARVLPEEHPELQAVRQNLAVTIKTLGDLPAALALEQQVLAVRLRTLPPDHRDLQIARQNLAVTISALGDLEGARALEEQVLDVFARTLPDEHPDLQRARQNLAETRAELGDLQGARALEEKVLEVRSRTLPADHPDLQAARFNLAVTIKALGDLHGALELQQAVLDVFARTLPDEHPHLQTVRLSLAATLAELGDLDGARALDEKVVEVRTRTLPADHRDLQHARVDLAASLYAVGDLAGARVLFEQTLEVFARTLPEDHPDVQAVRQNLAVVLKSLGDLAGARALEERALEVRSRALSDDHRDVQEARSNLASTLHMLGDLTAARSLDEKVLEVFSSRLSDDHPDLQRARQNLAGTLWAQGDIEGAHALFEKVLDVRARTLPPDHPDLQAARLDLALTLRDLGDPSAARTLEESVLETYARTLPDDHPDRQRARSNLALTIAMQVARTPREPERGAADDEARETARKQCVGLLGGLCRAQTRAARRSLVGSPTREAEARCGKSAEALDTVLSLVLGGGVFSPSHELDADAFELAEVTRGAALTSTVLSKRAVSDRRYRELRDALSAASEDLATLVRHGATSREFDRARVARDAAERDLVVLLDGLPDMPFRIAPGVEAIAAKLGPRDAAVAFRRFRMSHIAVAATSKANGTPTAGARSAEHLCAFVVRSSRSDPGAVPPRLVVLDLGSMEPVERAVEDWRQALGVAGARGVSVGGASTATDTNGYGDVLRRLVFDPLRPALGDCDHVVVELDDVLNLVPLDALPADRMGEAFLGDGVRIDVRATLAEIIGAQVAIDAPNGWLGVGAVDYGERSGPDARAAPVNDPSRGSSEAGILADTPWAPGFSPLPATRSEVAGIAARFVSAFGNDANCTIVDGADATKVRVVALAQRARFVHVATHGWYAPDSIRSWNDPEPLDAWSGLGMRQSGDEQVQGMSPLLLCGLALAGANSRQDPLGRVPGLITAEELAALDLSNCELAVLSACDTGVGKLARGGRGIASLQKALQMAGARSVITSLWKVPDVATKDLMLDFYRRLWVEKKPKWQALWEAKTKLRNARDADGKPLHTTRDWAAWVLTGEPD
ncbi:MAG: CHAT domain-containing protein [Planctomycetes bacterium]|nr:CHAT domain-containing protein [Planctomycetota bacterium]